MNNFESFHHLSDQ